MSKLVELIDARIARLESKIYTSIPASVIEYDDENQEAKLKLEVELEDAENSPLISCKVQFPGDSDYLVAHQIKVGTPGMAMFSCRAIKKWQETGETQSSRHQFSQNDAWFVPGISPDSESAIPPSEGVRLQSRDGERYLWLKNAGLECNVETTFKSLVTFDAGFDAKSKATLDGENLTKVSHTHKFTNADGVPSVTQSATE